MPVADGDVDETVLIQVRPIDQLNAAMRADVDVLSRIPELPEEKSSKPRCVQDSPPLTASGGPDAAIVRVASSASAATAGPLCAVRKCSGVMGSGFRPQAPYHTPCRRKRAFRDEECAAEDGVDSAMMRVTVGWSRRDDDVPPMPGGCHGSERAGVDAVIGGLAMQQPRSSAPSRPNIIFILADDLGWNDIGYHNPQIETPNLDCLAREGVRFNHHYVFPTCSPSRVALLTGRNPARFGVFAPLEATTNVRPQDMRLPFALLELGYTTHISGKWHIGETPEHRPRNYGFTTSYGSLRGQIDPYTHRYKTGNHVTWHRNDHFIEEDGHVTRLITDEAIRPSSSRRRIGRSFSISPITSPITR